ncbi:RNA polymerase sigma factor SigJ [Paractinoplanes toevensis]|uniref:RNA polymerase sigma24 factor n=1 Tax=Paractinoplanes toevensis TaxID=571911 RepID=A0A919VZ57_9ACTN|nr:RNA polymerase sigma factor SigJ [Actinoplanes toevensis]GIM89777.1 RNA polymerase sigma24 factor [Actinoplanes toevensis]
MTDEFVRHRPMLLGLAYRMVGSLHDAEDVLQEAYLRWAGADRSNVEQPRRYLTRVVARLAVDHLRARQARRESYVGEWLPEPAPAEAVDTTDLSYAVLHLMEQLTPPQRAVYVLRTAFDVPYEEVAEIVGRTETDCRQLLHRAQEALRSDHARFTPAPQEHERLLKSFVAAARDGDLATLRSLLHADVVSWSDGGGRVRTALNPIYTPAKVARFFGSIYSRMPQFSVESLVLNGLPAFLVTYPVSRHLLLLDTADGLIRGIYVVANPDKMLSAT